MQRVIFITHSTYLIDTGRHYLLFDYFRDIEGGDTLSSFMERPDSPLYVFCTHSHGDHYAPAVFGLDTGRRPVHYVFHSEVRVTVPERCRDRVVFLDTGERCSIDDVEVRAYGSTDAGGSFYVKVGDDKPFSLFHAGDLNNWHWNEEANDHYIRLYEAAYESELERFRHAPIALDLLMFPTDLRLGRDYLKGLRQFLAIVSAEYLAPMHLNGVLEDRGELTELCATHEMTLLFPDYEGAVHTIL